MKSSIHRPVMRGTSYVCANCGIFLRDVRTTARLRSLEDVDPIKLAAIEHCYISDPELARRLATEDLKEVVSTYKMADKFNDFLMNPKARPDLQTPEAQAFLKTLRRWHSPKTDALMPWLAREWKKGRVKHNQGPQYNDIRFEAGPDYEHEGEKFHRISPAELEHWGDWYNSDHPSRQGQDIMKLTAPELHQRVKDWDADMREQAGGAAQVRGNVVHSYPDGWTVQQLTTPQQLNDEGEKMGHCIGGYAKAVQNGESLIYSLRDHHNEPHATWEVTPNWYEDAEGKLHSTPNPELGTSPSPKEGTMQQIQGKGNEPPIPEYQKRIKDYYESTMPDWTDRPQWDDQHYNDLSEWLDPEEYNGYISYHPGDYGLEEPKTTYDWPSMTEQAAIGANEHYPENIVAKAVEEDQFHPFAGAMGRAIDQERQEREGNLKYEWNKYFYPEWLDLYETQNPRPQDEDYEHPERGFEDDRYLKDKENWEKQREQAADQELKNYQTEQNSTWGDHLDELEVEIAAQRRRERRIQEGEEGKGGEVIGPEDDAELPYRQSKVYGTHTHWSTGEPCNCTFTDHLDPREFWKVAAPMICETCGDPLYHTKCKRCDWGGWNHAMGDNEAIADPTKELKPGIQA